MRVVLCEDDLESSQGKRKGGGGQRKKERGKVIETQQWRRERERKSQVPRDRIKCKEKNLAGRVTEVINRNAVLRKTERGQSKRMRKQMKAPQVRKGQGAKMYSKHKMKGESKAQDNSSL